MSIVPISFAPNRGADGQSRSSDDSVTRMFWIAIAAIVAALILVASLAPAAPTI